MVTDLLLAAGGLFGEADCVARRAFRGVADVIAGRTPARKTNKGEASLSGDSLADMMFSQVICVDINHVFTLWRQYAINVWKLVFAREL